MSNPGVLSITSFRRLWIASSLSGLGDWLSILALTALAWSIAEGYTAQSYAVGAVLGVKALTVLALGPLGEALADRLDRRLTMIVADVLRFALILSVPLVGELVWLLVAAFLVELLALVWTSARDTTVPALVPPAQLEQARRQTLRTAYGTAPIAAALFAVLALVAKLFAEGHRADLALYFTSVTFLISALTVASMGDLPAGPRRVSAPSPFGQIVDGWRNAGSAPQVRGLVTGVVGVFAVVGAVIGVSRIYVDALEAGDAGYGVLFGAVFVGLAAGMFLGPRMLRGFSRNRLAGLAIVFAALVLVGAALIHDLVAVVVLVALVGVGAGVAWANGRALLTAEVARENQGRAAGFLQALVRVVVLLVAAVVPLAAGAIGAHTLKLGDLRYRADGANAVLLLGAVVALLAGLAAYRQMDDRRGIPLGRDLYGALRGVPYEPKTETTGKRRGGLFIAFEGGEGAGKTTQSRLLAIWLRDNGFDVVTTREPGATKVGMRLRAILLDKETTALSHRAESLLYAADRAQHVAQVIRPALETGAIVVTDRYIDSSLAYQAYGRGLSPAEIAEVNAWATDALTPDLTILLDVAPSIGLNRFNSPADRIESEPADFHDRVRRGFRTLAEAEPDRYLVVDASLAQSEITRQIQDKVLRVLPDPIPATTEDITSTFPAITDA